MSEIRVNKVINAAGADAPNFPYGFSVAAGYGITGGGNVVGTAATFSGAVNIDATTDSTSVTTGALIVDGGLGVAKNVWIGAGLSVAGTLTYEDVTNVDSVGVITAKSGINITAGDFEQTGGGEFKVGTALTMASTSGVATFSSDVYFANPADSTKYAQWNPSNDRLNFQDNAQITWGTGSDLKIYHDASHSFIEEAGTGALKIRGDDVRIENSGGNNILKLNGDVAELFYAGNKKIETTNDGVSITGMTTTSAGMTFNGMLKEEVNIVANKLSAGVNIDVADGMVHYYSTNETATATPNIRFNSSYSLNNKMAVGQTITVTIIYKPNGAGYYAQLQVDGSNVTEYWNGGAPSSANAGGLDVLTHTITKTADAAYAVVLSNVQNYTS